MKATDVRHILEETYLNAPYDKYVLCFGVEKLRTMRESGRIFDLWEGQSLEEKCVVAYLKRRIPRRMVFPQGAYQGVRIFQSISGKQIH